MEEVKEAWEEKSGKETLSVHVTCSIQVRIKRIKLPFRLTHGHDHRLTQCRGGSSSVTHSGHARGALDEELAEELTQS